MAEAKQEEDEHEVEVMVSVVAFPLPTSHVHGIPTNPRLEEAREIHSFVQFCPRHDMKMHEVLELCEATFTREYRKGKKETDGPAFSKMRHGKKHVDILPHQELFRFFPPRNDFSENKLVLIHDPSTNHSPTSKERNDTPRTTQDLESAEPTTDKLRQPEIGSSGDDAGDAAAATFDADGDGMPRVPSSQSNKSNKKRRSPSPPHTSQTVLVQDSQPQASVTKPPLSAQPWLKKPQAGGHRQQSISISHSSPAEDAASRSRTGAPQHRTHDTSSTLRATSGNATNSDGSRKSLPTPHSTKRKRSADEAAPTSAQRPPSSPKPFPPAHLQSYFKQSAAADIAMDDPIIDDDDFLPTAPEENFIDDNDNDSDYFAVEEAAQRRSTSPQPMRSCDDADGSTEQPGSQPPAIQSSASMTDSSRAAAPTPTPYTDVISSQRHSSASKAVPGKWEKQEDIALLRGLKFKLKVPEIIRLFDLSRTESAVRNRHASLLKFFINGKVPRSHEFYNAVEKGVDPREGRRGATFSAQRTNWAHNEEKLLRKGIAAGMDAAEIRKKHFGIRSQESVTKKFKDLFDGVVSREQKFSPFPTDDLQVPGWTDQHSLFLRRAVHEEMTADEAWSRWFAAFPKTTIERKMDIFHADLLKTPDAHPNMGAPRSDPPPITKGSVTPFKASGAVQQKAGVSQSTSRKRSKPNRKALTRTPTVPSSIQSRAHRQASSNVAITPKEEDTSTTSHGQLKRKRGNDGQTMLNYQRDKRKGVDLPSRVDRVAEADREYSRTSSRAQPQQADTEMAMEAVEEKDDAQDDAADETAKEVEVVDMRDEDSDDDFHDFADVDEIIPTGQTLKDDEMTSGDVTGLLEDENSMDEDEKSLLRQIDSGSDNDAFEPAAETVADAKLQGDEMDQTPPPNQEHGVTAHQDDSDGEDDDVVAADSTGPNTKSISHSRLTEQPANPSRLHRRAASSSSSVASDDSQDINSPGKQLTQELEQSVTPIPDSYQEEAVTQPDPQPESKDSAGKGHAAHSFEEETATQSLTEPEMIRDDTLEAEKAVQPISKAETVDSDDESQAFQTQDPTTSRSQRELQRSAAATRPAQSDPVEIPAFPAIPTSLHQSASANPRLDNGAWSHLPPFESFPNAAPKRPPMLSDLLAANGYRANDMNTASTPRLADMSDINGPSSKFMQAKAAVDAARNASRSGRPLQSSSQTPAQSTSCDLPVITKPHDLRNPLSAPNAIGQVMLGRTRDFATPVYLNTIKTDQQIWQECLFLSDNDRALAKANYEMQWLEYQLWLAMSTQDRGEQARLNGKLEPLRRLVSMKAKGKIAMDADVSELTPAHAPSDSDVDGEVFRGNNFEGDGESDFDDDFEEEVELDAGWSDGEEYPDGVEHDREFIEVEDDEEEQPSANSINRLPNGHAREAGESKEDEDTTALGDLMQYEDSSEDSDEEDSDLPSAPPMATDEDVNAPSDKELQDLIRSGDVQIFDEDRNFVGTRPNIRRSSPIVCVSPLSPPNSRTATKESEASTSPRANHVSSMRFDSRAEDAGGKKRKRKGKVEEEDVAVKKQKKERKQEEEEMAIEKGKQEGKKGAELPTKKEKQENKQDEELIVGKEGRQENSQDAEDVVRKKRKRESKADEEKPLEKASSKGADSDMSKEEQNEGQRSKKARLDSEIVQSVDMASELQQHDTGEAARKKRQRSRRNRKKRRSENTSSMRESTARRSSDPSTLKDVTVNMAAVPAPQDVVASIEKKQAPTDVIKQQANSTSKPRAHGTSTSSSSEPAQKKTEPADEEKDGNAAKFWKKKIGEKSSYPDAPKSRPKLVAKKTAIPFSSSDDSDSDPESDNDD